MRNKRAKTYRKLLAAYIRAFGLRAPFQVLIDATMAQSLAAMKLRPDEVYTRLETVLQASAALPAGQRPQTFPSASTSKAAAYIKPMITQCAMNELYKKQKDGDVEAKAVELAKSWERRYCNHREAIPGDRCMREVIGE
jgi:U3 small nucleolar RNA-associated protein 23